MPTDNAAGNGPEASTDADQPDSERPKAPVEDLGRGCFRVGSVSFDSTQRTITIPATMHMREGAVEYLLVTTKGKIHEAVFTTSVDPHHVHVAALLLGMKPQPDLGPANAAAKAGSRGALDAWVEWDRNGPPARLPLHEAVAITDPASNTRRAVLAAGPWLYNGSIASLGDPFTASRSGSLVSIIRDPEALINYRGVTRDNDEIHSPNAPRLPKKGHPVRILLKLR